MVFHGRRYGKGSVDAELIELMVTAGGIRTVDNTGCSIALDLDALELQAVGQDFDRLQLYEKSTGTTIICDDPAFSKALMDAQLAGRIPGMEKIHAAIAGSKGRRTRYWSMVAAVTLLICGLCYFALELMVSNAISLVDPKLESKLGEFVVHAERNLDSKSTDYERVKRIGDRLVSKLDKNPYKFHFYVRESDDINAYAMPGGSIIVLSQLVKRAKSDDELAGILGHEIGHVIHRDSLKGAFHQAGLLIAVQFLLGGGQNANDLLGLAEKLEAVNYTRSQEAAADIVGVQLASRAGYDPEGVILFFDAIQKEDPLQNNKMLAFMSDHPMPEERIKAIREEVRRLKALKG